MGEGVEVTEGRVGADVAAGRTPMGVAVGLAVGVETVGASVAVSVGASVAVGISTTVSGVSVALQAVRLEIVAIIKKIRNRLCGRSLQNRKRLC